MLLNKIIYYAVFLVLSALSRTTFALQCYQCESLSNPKCGEHFEMEDRMIYDCSRVAPPRYLQTIIPSLHNATGCMKKIMEAGAGHPQIIRSCYFGNNDKIGCQTDPTLPFIKQLSCEVCEGNLCNGSNFITPPVAFAVAILCVLSHVTSKYIINDIY